MTEHSAQSQAPLRIRWWHALGAGLLHSGLMLLAFPSVSLWGFAFLAAIPLVWLGWVSPRPFRHGLCVLIGALPFYAVHLSYIADITVAGFPPLLVFMAAWPGAFVWLLGMAHRRASRLPAWVLAPIVWVGLDALRGEVIGGGFEWYFVSHPLIESARFAAPAMIGGVYLVTLMVVALSGIALEMRLCDRTGKKRAISAFVVLAALWSTASFTAGEFHSEQTLSVAVVQTNVPQDNKIGWTIEARRRDFAEFLGLTRETLTGEPDLIIWPETMFPGFALDDAGSRVLDDAGLSGFNGMRDELLAFQREIGIPMLVGATTAENLRVVDDDDRFWFESDATYNSVYVIRDGGVREDRYDKIAPTPFGETLPYINSWPWLKRMILRIGLGASGMDFGLEAGDGPRTLTLDLGGDRLEIAAPVCFESSMSRVVRRLANAGEGTNLMVVMTNDGWFASSDRGRRVHLMLARWRCLELGLPMVRSANTGISAAISHRGRIGSVLSPQEPGVLVLALEAGRARTLYRVIGNTVAWICLAGLGVLALICMKAALRDRRARKVGSDS